MLTVLVTRPCLLHIFIRLLNQLSYTNKRIMGLALSIPYNHWPHYSHRLFHSRCLGRLHIISSPLSRQEYPYNVFYSSGSSSRHTVLESQAH